MTDVFQQEVLSGNWSIRKERDGIVSMKLMPHRAGAAPMLESKLDRGEAITLALELLDALEVPTTVYEDVQGALAMGPRPGVLP